MFKNLNFIGLLFIFFSLFGIIACEEEESIETLYEKAIENYANIVEATYEDSYEAAVSLKNTINSFVANPTQAGFDECKAKWLAARVPYGQSEAFRFYGGPIDDENGPEGLINAWPMDENFIDYVVGNPNAGIINDTTNYPTVSKDILVNLNESISETSIFTGYHAIEFLLWGQDFSETTAGTRPYTDFLDGGTAENQARRRDYLVAVAELLVENLEYVLNEWKSDGSYRKTFLALDYSESFGAIFTALGELSKGELAGERMFVALDSKDQEDEHSCFSDNTHVDIEMNYLGIKNVYYGSYIRTNGSIVSGVGFDVLAEKQDKVKADVVKIAFLTTNVAIADIPVPFDQGIVNESDKLLVIIEALRDLSDGLIDVGFLLGAIL